MDYKLEFEEIDFLSNKLKLEIENFNYNQKKSQLKENFDLKVYNYLLSLLPSDLPPTTKIQYSQFCLLINFNNKNVVRILFNYNESLKTFSKEKVNQIVIKPNLTTTISKENLIILGIISQTFLDKNKEILSQINLEINNLQKDIKDKVTIPFNKINEKGDNLKSRVYNIVYTKIYNELTVNKILHIKNPSYTFFKTDEQHIPSIEYIKVLNVENDKYDIEIKSILNDNYSHYMSTTNLENFVKIHIINSQPLSFRFLFEDILPPLHNN